MLEDWWWLRLSKEWNGNDFIIIKKRWTKNYSDLTLSQMKECWLRNSLAYTKHYQQFNFQLRHFHLKPQTLPPFFSLPIICCWNWWIGGSGASLRTFPVKTFQHRVVITPINPPTNIRGGSAKDTQQSSRWVMLSAQSLGPLAWIIGNVMESKSSSTLGLSGRRPSSQHDDDDND